MKRVESIEIENVKGIKKKKFDLDLIPNMPSLLVAPNGFGKSSFAIAFQSLTAGGIKLDKDSFHCNDQNNDPKIVVTYINNSNVPVISNADKNENSIKDHFDIFIINSRIVPKAKKLKISGNIIVTSSLEIAPISLINKVPEKATLPCTAVSMKARFGDNGKVVPNLGSIFGNSHFICALEDNVDFEKLDGARIINSTPTDK